MSCRWCDQSTPVHPILDTPIWGGHRNSHRNQGDWVTSRVYSPVRVKRSGNVMVNSAEHEFNFLASEQGETYIRINSIPLRFTRTGEFTLEVTQSPWLR